MNPLIVIPARLDSVRFPRKVLAPIEGTPLIVHCWRSAVRSLVAPVVVAASHQEIIAPLLDAGARTLLTSSHPSGSDRVAAAVALIDPLKDIDVVINVQGDLPFFEPPLLKALMEPFAQKEVDITTLAAPIEQKEGIRPSVVKVIAGLSGEIGEHARALAFTRAPAPFGEGPLYEHIGLYAYRREALERFVRFPLGRLEVREHLEQMRALEQGMHMEVVLVPSAPQSVDTPEDLATLIEGLRFSEDALIERSVFEAAQP